MSTRSDGFFRVFGDQPHDHKNSYLAKFTNVPGTLDTQLSNE